MIVMKIIGISFVALVGYNILKYSKPEFSVALVVAAGTIILVILSDKIIESVAAFKFITEKSGLSENTFSMIIKIIGIGYVTEYASNVCEDGGSKSLGQKIRFAGKITIFLLALPIVYNVFTVIEGLV